MKYHVIKSINSNSILTIVFRGNSDIREWRDGLVKPFVLLNEETMYSVIYVISKKHGSSPHADIGTPKDLHMRLIERLEDSDQFTLTIYIGDNKKEAWIFN